MSGATFVVIDDSTSKVISGVYEFDRDNGGVLLVPSGSTLPVSPEPKELFWLTTDNKLYRRNDGNTVWEAVVSAPAVHAIGGADHSASTLAEVNSKISDATLDDAGDPRVPTAHASTHENGGSDEVSVAGLSGALADPQTPLSHASTHQNGGSDEIGVAGLSGVLADRQDADKIQGRSVDSASPTVNQVLAWDGSKWSPSDKGGEQDSFSVYKFFDDFIGQNFRNRIWSTGTSGSGSNVRINTADQDAPGVVRVRAGNVASASAYMETNDKQILLADLEYKCRARQCANCASGNYTELALAVASNKWIGFSRWETENWSAVTQDGSTTQTVTAVAYDTNYHDFRFAINAAGTEVTFWIDGVLVATHTANIPSGRAMLSFYNETITANGTKDLLVDFVQVKGVRQ